METTEKRAANFIEEFIDEDLADGRFDHVRTRFPPEPNGYLHIGHAKALCIDFGIAQKYGGKCNLRFDDTNPTKEDAAFVEGIQADIEWLGYKWDELHFASDFFGKLYEIACDLIRKRRGLRGRPDARGNARQSRHADQTRREQPLSRPHAWRKTWTCSERMKDGEFPDGSRVLRAKIDMASPNVLHARPDHVPHPAPCITTEPATEWCIYPMYDFQHPAAGRHRGRDPLAVLAGIRDPPPAVRLVRAARPGYRSSAAPDRVRPPEHRPAPSCPSATCAAWWRRGYVSGWDDPRMPTLVAMRRRGYPAEAIQGLHRAAWAWPRPIPTVEGALLEHCVREALGDAAPRAMAVLDPLKVTLVNWPEDQRG